MSIGTQISPGMNMLIVTGDMVKVTIKQST